jgi:peptidoglycan/LPS O-acetylase OafA/YrhL
MINIGSKFGRIQGDTWGKMTKIASLDGFRAIAVLLVVFSHAGYGDLIPGGLGVTIFFFLSGYLITTLLKKEYAGNGSISIKDFYLRRIYRLIPSLLITLLVAHILVHLGLLQGGSTIKGALAQIFYMSNYLDVFGITIRDVPAGTVVLWSLAVEEHFYIFYPVCFLLLSRRFKNKEPANLLIALSLFILAWRLFEYYALKVRTELIEFRTDSRFDSIMWGCIFGLLSSVPSKGERSPTWKESVFFLSGLIGLLFTLVYRNDQFRFTLRYTIQGICLIPIFKYSIEYSQISLFKWLNNWVLEWIGKNSYAIYLVHFIIIELIRKTFPSIKSSLLVVTIALFGSFLYAYCLEITIEPTFKRLRAKHRSQAVAAH